MSRCFVLFVVALVFAGSAAWVDARPVDVKGWDAARWGMTEKDLKKSFGARLIRLPGKWVYQDAYATRAIKDVPLGDLRFRAIFQMNAKDGRLEQVLLEPERRTRQEAAFRSALAALRKTYGPPGRHCAVPGKDGVPLSVEYWWRFPTTTVHIVFFDFYTRAIPSEDPNLEHEPLAPFYWTRRNNPQFLPRRTVVRFHPTARSDLISATCPANGG